MSMRYAIICGMKDKPMTDGVFDLHHATDNIILSPCLVKSSAA
jgi:hypothetical protein